MGGSNPYIEEVKYKPATKKYKVTFLPSGKTIEVDPEKIPYGHNGIPGSILDISEGIKAGLDHACGGVCACSTCHVILREGLESCNEATDAELDEQAQDRKSTRLNSSHVAISYAVFCLKKKKKKKKKISK